MLFKRRSLLVCVLALTCAATPPHPVPHHTAAQHPAPQPTAAPFSADTLTAYQTGQAYERLRQDTIQPGVCGIVLERPQCLADLRLVQAAHGADTNDAALETWLTNGDLGDKVTNWTVTSYAPGAQWAKNPTNSWYWSMGIVSESAWLPLTPDVSTLLSANIASVSARVSQAPPHFDRSLLSGTDAVASGKRLNDAMAALQPPPVFPSVSVSSGAIGDMQLGVLTETVSLLMSNPYALARPESRAFVNAVLDQLDKMHTDLKDGVSVAATRAAFNSDIPSNSEELNAKLRSAWSQVTSIKSLPTERAASVLAGLMIALVPYDAAILKQSGYDSDTRKLLAAVMKIVPKGIPGATRDAINHLATEDASDWKTVGADATAAELAIMQPPPSPHP